MLLKNGQGFYTLTFFHLPFLKTMTPITANKEWATAIEMNTPNGPKFQYTAIK